MIRWGKDKNGESQGTSLVGQWLKLCAPNAGGSGSIPGRGTRSHVYATAREPACRN